MRLFRFIIKRGKVGSIAKLAAQSYKHLRMKMPNDTEAEILEAIYCIYGAARVAEGKRVWSKVWYQEINDQEKIEWRRNNPPANLRDAVLRIVNRDSDFPFVPDHLAYKQLQLEMEMAEVVEEVLDREVPGWRDRSAKPAPPPRPRGESQQAKRSGLAPRDRTAMKSTSAERNPEALLFFSEAMRLLDLQKCEQAIQKLDFALRCAPDFQEAWCAKGQTLEALGNHEQAIHCYERAPGLFQAWCNRGLVLRRLGRNEMALQSYDRALALNGRDKITWLNRGVVLEKLGRSNDALASYDSALAIDSNHADAWVNKADLLRRLKRYEEASTCFDRGLGLNPADSIGWTNKGIFLSEQGRLNEAVSCFETAVRYNKRLERAWMEMGICRGELEQFDEARGCFNVVLELNPKDGYAWHNKGIAILQTYQNYVEASLCFGQALRLGVGEAESYLEMCEQQIEKSDL